MTELKTGVKVLIPGTIREVMGSGLATVETEARNHIVEHMDDLVIDGPRSVRALSVVEERTERLARAMCAADSVNPDAKASVGQPLMLPTGYVVMGTSFEAWRLYVKYARAVIDKGLA